MSEKVIFDKCAKFFNSLHIEGAIYSEDNILCDCISKDKRLKFYTILKNTKKNSKVYFSLQLTFETTTFLNDLEIELVFKNSSYNYKLGEINESIVKRRRNAVKIPKKYLEYLKNDTFEKVLDIGGRARSGIYRADTHKEYNKKVTVLDIIEDEGVDIVGDCHEMSKVLPHNHFDIIFSSAVFEHLIMPWKVVIEMNRVMKTGAIAMVGTHQTVGMHDMPWDFYRFSDTSWHGLFNKYTGFEIIKTELSELQYIIPFCYEEHLACAEKSAGYRGSMVIAKKISDTSLDWDLRASNVLSNLYPEN